MILREKGLSHVPVAVTVALAENRLGKVRARKEQQKEIFILFLLISVGSPFSRFKMFLLY